MLQAQLALILWEEDLREQAPGVILKRLITYCFPSTMELTAHMRMATQYTLSNRKLHTLIWPFWSG